MRDTKKRKRGTPVGVWVYIFEIVKWAAFAAIVVILLQTRVAARPSKTDFDTMQAAVTAGADLENTKESDALLLKRFYSLDQMDYDRFVYYSPKTNMGAEELLLIHLSDPKQEGRVMESINARVETQLASFEGYGVDQTELLKNAVIVSKGNYCLLYVGAGADEVENAFRQAL